MSIKAALPGHEHAASRCSGRVLDIDRVSKQEIPMHSNKNDLRHLAGRACKGDSQALVKLRQELRPHLLRIVHRAMRSTSGASTLTERIQATADRLFLDETAHPTHDSEALAMCVANDLCESLVSELHRRPKPVPGTRETIRNH
jgi:hypothetical protein